MLIISVCEISLKAAFDVAITPSPCFVVKIIRSNGEKLFVNLCEHANIPMVEPVRCMKGEVLGFNKWPFMVLTPARYITEESNEDSGRKSSMQADIAVYDAVISSEAAALTATEPAAKDAVSS